MYYSSLYQLLRVLLLSWYIVGIAVLYILASVLASYIHILGYLLKHLLSKANLLVLSLLFLKVLLLYFLPLLSLFKALKYLPPIILTILQLRFFFPKLAFISLAPIYLSSIGPTSVILQ